MFNLKSNFKNHDFISAKVDIIRLGTFGLLKTHKIWHNEVKSNIIALTQVRIKNVHGLFEISLKIMILFQPR